MLLVTESPGKSSATDGIQIPYGTWQIGPISLSYTGQTPLLGAETPNPPASLLLTLPGSGSTFSPFRGLSCIANQMTSPHEAVLKRQGKGGS